MKEKMKKSFVKKAISFISAAIVAAVSSAVPVSSSEQFNESEAQILVDNVRKEINFIKKYAAESQWYYNMYAEGIDVWHKENQPPDDSVIRNKESGEIQYVPFSPFAKTSTQWNENHSPVSYYSSISELRESLQSMIDRDTVDWMLNDRMEGIGRPGAVPWLFVDDNGKEWMSEMPLTEFEPSEQKIIYLDGLIIDGDNAEANVYVVSNVQEAYLKIPVSFKKDESGWKLSECDYLKFILRGVSSEKQEDYHKFFVYKMPEGYQNGSSPQTGDRTGALIAITAASLLSLSACVIFRRKVKEGEEK